VTILVATKPGEFTFSVVVHHKDLGKGTLYSCAVNSTYLWSV